MNAIPNMETEQAKNVIKHYEELSQDYPEILDDSRDENAINELKGKLNG